MYSIGDVARISGLTVSALRFYDRAGLLRPAFVDPSTGYRWYAPDQVRPARLIARLRRVQMPLTGIAAVVAADPPAAARLLAAHLRRLEDGLADARRELSRVQSLIEESIVTSTRMTFDPAEFAAAVHAVRFAAGSDPEFPALTGILAEARDGMLRLVATDRYRLAVAEVTAVLTGPPASAIVPTELFGDAGELSIDGESVTVGAASATRVRGDFPDYRRLTGGPGAERVTAAAAELREAVATAPVRRKVRGQDGVVCDVTVLAADGGRLTLTDTSPGIGVDREFLLAAIDAAGEGHLVLDLDGPIRPLAIRGDRAFSLLMPTTLD